MLPIDHVTIERFAELTGYSEDAVRSKIKRGQWRNGHEFIKAPDGRVLMSLEGYAQWVTNGATKGSGLRPAVALRSISTTKERAAANASSSSPPPLT